MTFSLTITNWSAWAPGIHSHEDWEHAGDGNFPDLDRLATPPIKDLPMMLRRRLSRLGRMAMRVALDMKDEGNDVRLVFSSRYGEATQTAQLLTDLANNEGMSPTAFSMSVHNALAGLLSIHQKNNLPHTAIAAGDESFCAALTEAAALLVEDAETPVLLVHYDEPLPEFYEPFDDKTVPSLALALLLEAKSDKGLPVNFGFTTLPSSTVIENADAALGFIQFLGKPETAWLWNTPHRQWWCNHHGS